MAQNRGRLRSSLDEPDNDRWHEDPNYQPDLAKTLRYAYALIHDARTAPDHSDYHLRAYAILREFKDRHVCAEQRLRLQYALALACTGENDLPYALDYLDHALELADRLGDWAALTELSYLAGSVLHHLFRHRDAYVAYGEALAALRQLERDGTPADAEFELDLVLRHAWRAWELGMVPASLRGLDEAYALRARWVSDAALDAASLAWLDAQLARVRGQPVRAVALAKAAADTYLAHGKTGNAGRIQVFTAECMFDVAEVAWSLRGSGAPSSAMPPIPADPASVLREDPSAMYAHAMGMARQGLEILRQSGDVAGVSLGRLTLRRGRRLGAGTGTAVAIREIERIARGARMNGDMATVGRAQAALGDELIALDRLEHARTLYYRATLTFQEFGFGGLAIWPNAALARHAR